MKMADTTKRTQEKPKGFTKKIGTQPMTYHFITADRARGMSKADDDAKNRGKRN